MTASLLIRSCWRNLQPALRPATAARVAGIVWRRACLLGPFVLLGIAVGATAVSAATADKSTPSSDRPVSYEAFGAVGDGVADDLPAIVEAHAFANTHDLPVRTKPGATYHLGRRALTVVIMTDTD